MRVTRHQPAIPPSISLPPRRTRRALIALVFGLLAVGAVCERSSQPAIQGDDHSRYHDRSFRVARVIDGDTLDIASPDGVNEVTRIRLWGVDSPEVGQDPRQVMYFGSEASEYAKQTLSGKTVHVVLSPRRTRGKYGRLLAYVYLDRGGPMFNELLLEDGYAYADLRFDHHYYDQFKAIEKRAQRAGRGLWAEVTVDKMPEWKQRFEKH